MHELSGIDPSRAENLQQLGAMVAELIDSRGMSRNQAARAAGISPSTLGEIISARRTKPHAEKFKNLIDSFELPDAEQKAWIKRKIELARVDSEAGQQEIFERLERAESAVAEAREHIVNLQKEEARLQVALKAEQQRAAELTESHGRASAQAEELEAQLKHVQTELWQTEYELRKFVEQKDILQTANDALLAQLELLQEEQAQHKVAERSIQRLEAQVSEIGQAYSTLRSATLDAEVEEVVERPVSKEPQPAQIKNEPLVTTIALRDRDFGNSHKFEIVFPWYCFKCKTGGSQQPYVCPRCGGEIVYYEPVSFTLELPKEPNYGKRLIARNVGNHDNPNLLRGDVHIRVVRKESRWRRR